MCEDLNCSCWSVRSGGPVILESPVHPVQAGETVTLRCTSKMTSSSNLTTEFYKDDTLIGGSSTGNMTIHSASTSDEGVYKCKISGAGESPDSWLAVRGETSFSSVVESYRRTESCCCVCIEAMLWFFFICCVEAGRPESFHYPLAHILLPVVGVCLSFASVMLLCRWWSRKGQYVFTFTQ